MQRFDIQVTVRRVGCSARAVRTPSRPIKAIPMCDTFLGCSLSPTNTRTAECETVQSGGIKHVRAQLLLHTCHQRLIWAAYMYCCERPMERSSRPNQPARLTYSMRRSYTARANQHITSQANFYILHCQQKSHAAAGFMMLQSFWAAMCSTRYRSQLLCCFPALTPLRELQSLSQRGSRDA